MGLTLVTAPTLDPVTLAEVKAHCRITEDEDDGLLAGYILAARQHVETYTQRALLTQTYDLTVDYEWPRVKCVAEWRYRIVLPRPPTISVTSISYVDVEGTTQTLATNQYTPPRKLNSGEWAIEPAYGVTWPTVRDQLAAVTVRFVAGYGSSIGDIPEEIRQAMLLLIGFWYDNRETINIGSINSELPFTVATLLFPHRVFY